MKLFTSPLRWLLLALALPLAATAQPQPTPVALSLDDALQIALENNYTLVERRLDVANADAQIKEAWGSVFPSVNLNSSYTRNVVSANPFAGSDAGGLFGALGSIDWLAFNEEARTDGDPTTDPITLQQFRERQFEGYQNAGIELNQSDNPFSVPNQFQNGVSVQQTLYNGSAFAAIRGAERLREINQAGADRQRLLTVQTVKQAYYRALLAQEQVAVLARSYGRTATTVAEAQKLVAQGVASKYQRLSAEVDLANLDTQLITARSSAQTALDNLKFVLGLPIQQPIRLSGALTADEAARYTTVSSDEALDAAADLRDDLRQAQLAIELNEVQRDITRAEFLPNLSAFANLNYTGSVPDNRTRVLADPNDPFTFTQQENGFFDDGYWNPSVAVGLSLSWNLFDGFRTRARLQQQRIAIDRAEVQLAQLRQAVSLEVETALRNLSAARQRILSSERNIERAELNYEFASARLREGVASPLEERTASEQLDQSQLNYLQAVYDYLVARTAFETAVGAPLEDASELYRFTSNE